MLRILMTLFIILTIRALEAYAVEEAPVRVLVEGNYTNANKNKSLSHQKVRHPLSSSTQLDEADLQKKAVSGLTDILAQTPGVVPQGGPRGQLVMPQIRGMDSQKILILVDGVPQNYRTRNNGSFFFESSLLKSVEIVKSSASTLYGNGAMGGALILTTKDGRDFLKSSHFPFAGAALGSSYSSANQELEKKASLFFGSSKSDALIHYVKREADDLRQGKGAYLPFSAYKDQDLQLKASTSFDEGKNRLSVSYDSYKAYRRSPLAEVAPTTQGSLSNIPLSDDDSYRESSKLSFEREDNFEINTYHNYTFTTKRKLDDNRLDIRKLITNGGEYHQAYEVQKEKLNLLWGASYLEDQQEGSRNGEALGSFPKGRGNTLGAFSTLDYSLWQQYLSLAPGLRYDHYQIQSQNQKRQDGEMTYALALTSRPSSFSQFRLSYNEGYNAPRIYQLYPDGYHFILGTYANYFKPNPALKAEKSRHYELSSRLNFEDSLLANDEIQLEWDIFQKDVTNYIYNTVNILQGSTQYTNLAFARFYGTEWSASFNEELLFSKISYSIVRAYKGHNTKTSKPLSTAPADTWNFLLGLQKQYKKHYIRSGYDGQLAWAQNRIDQSDEEITYATDSYFIHNIFMTYTYDKNLDLVLRINNLLDKYYRRHGAYQFESGRDLRISAQYLF